MPDSIMLETGDKAPRLKGTLQDGSTIRLADYVGKPFKPDALATIIRDNLDEKISPP